VFRLQFDEFQIVSSSHDDTILVWDFLNFDDRSTSGATTSLHPPQQMSPDNVGKLLYLIKQIEITNFYTLINNHLRIHV